MTADDLLSYIDRRVCGFITCYGRRDNKYKARIKILVHETGTEELIAVRWTRNLPRVATLELEAAGGRYSRRISSLISRAPDLAETAPKAGRALPTWKKRDPEFARVGRARHRAAPQAVPDYGDGDHFSLKPIGGIPGDATDADQMDAVADLCGTLDYALDEIRVTHEQNISFCRMWRWRDLEPVYLWQALVAAGLATANSRI